ncbi:MAG: glycoside hydrolase family 26 protein [Treponema sp.]|nr:glycoside hydrolase family 26 protein [Treponema sp.]
MNTIYDISPELSNPKADDNAKRLMKYLADTFGKKVIAGWTSDPPTVYEFQAVKKITGREPAVIGMDFGGAPGGEDLDSVERVIRYAIDWDKKGGIVTFQIHWKDPRDHRNFYNEGVEFDLVQALDDPGCGDHDALIKDIDTIAECLGRLRDAGVPVIWRPLHEAEGRWFWWGNKGPEPYKKLWRLMYDRMTNYHSLTNLIWSWNAPHKDWFPGGDVIDLASADMYIGAHTHGSYLPSFSNLADILNLYNVKKYIYTAEVDSVPDIEAMQRDNAMWGMFLPWTGGTAYQVKEGTWRDPVLDENGTPRYSEEINSSDTVKKLFSDERVITLDRLPNLKTYS